MPDSGTEEILRSALAALASGDEPVAEGLFREVTSRDPLNAEAWHVLATIACRAGRAEEGFSLAERAHALSRRDATYLNTLGIASAELGRLDDAVQWLRRAAKQRPNYVDAHYNLGKALAKRGELAEAERELRRAAALAPQRLDVASNLGVVLLERPGTAQEALTIFENLSRAAPDNEQYAVSLGNALWATEGAPAAGAHYQRFLENHREAALVHYVLALNLLARGRFDDGWREYDWRRRLAGMRLPERGVDALPADLSGRRILLRREQGLGDELFFLRFVPELRRRGARVAFDCSPKLAPLLSQSPLLEPLTDPDMTLCVADLPLLLGSTATPPPFPLAPEPRRLETWRQRLAAAGPPPYVGVTWRAGTALARQAEFAGRDVDALRKEVPLPLLAGALAGASVTLVLLQRHPEPGEAVDFSRRVRRPSCDLTALNEELADMTAVLALIDDYVAVSNTNVHLRASCGRPSRVLVPFPPEFRWMGAGDASPWFPEHRLYRQGTERTWDSALGRLIGDLKAS